MGLPVAVSAGVGANADLPFTVAVGDGVVVGDVAAVGDGAGAGRGATVAGARPPGCRIAATPTAEGWFEPLFDGVVDTGWWGRATTAASGGGAGNGRKGEWTVGPPSRVLNSRQT